MSFMSDPDDLRHGGQSNTINSMTDPETGETVASSDEFPDLGEIRDMDPQLARQLLMQLIAALQSKSSSGQDQMLLGRSMLGPVGPNPEEPPPLPPTRG